MEWLLLVLVSSPPGMQGARQRQRRSTRAAALMAPGAQGTGDAVAKL